MGFFEKMEAKKNACLIVIYEERMLKEGFQKEGDELILYRVLGIRPSSSS